jgi:hypothetical protein
MCVCVRERGRRTHVRDLVLPTMASCFENRARSPKPPARSRMV